MSVVSRPTLLTSIAPRCQGTVGSIVGLVPGVLSLSPGESVAGAHQGRHSKSSQYRRMKADWKSNVYLARSRIQVSAQRISSSQRVGVYVCVCVCARARRAWVSMLPETLRSAPWSSSTLAPSSGVK